MNLKNQRRMAAKILNCGVNRVWIDPNRMEDLEDAITRADIRTAIASGTIRKLPAKGISTARHRFHEKQKSKGRRRGHGKRKGTRTARTPKKRAWISMIRPVRARLKQLKDEKKIDESTYRKFYLQAKGGMFKNRVHLEQQLKASGAFKEGQK